MRFVSHKMSLWLYHSIDESQMDLWLWLRCRPAFAIARWTSSTRHLKLKAAINKLIILLSRMCPSISLPPWGAAVFSNHYSSQLSCSHYSSFSFFSPINSQTDLQPAKKCLTFPIGFFLLLPQHLSPEQILIMPNHSVSNLLNTMRPHASLCHSFARFPMVPSSFYF